MRSTLPYLFMKGSVSGSGSGTAGMSSSGCVSENSAESIRIQSLSTVFLYMATDTACFPSSSVMLSASRLFRASVICLKLFCDRSGADRSPSASVSSSWANCSRVLSASAGVVCGMCLMSDSLPYAEAIARSVASSPYRPVMLSPRGIGSVTPRSGSVPDSPIGTMISGSPTDGENMLM